jgi:signal transduction histidine kinase
MRYRGQVMSVLTVNQEALKVYRAKSVESVIAHLEGEMNDVQRLGIIEDLVNFANGRRRSNVHCRTFRETGEEFPIIAESEVYGEDPDDWSQVLLTVRDTSAEEAVRMSEIRYRRLFESAPVAMYESDWSAAKLLMDDLRERGVQDLDRYFREHPEIMRRRGDVLRITSVNAEALRIYNTSNTEDQIRLVEGSMNEEQRLAMVKAMITFAGGKRRSTEKSISVRENGEIFPILRDCELISSDREDWSRVLISVRDLSIEEEAARQLEAYQQELRSLAGKISLAEESERRRISSELHDGTIQNLVLARIHLANLRNSLDTPSDLDQADSINDLLESSLQETRSLIFEISPPVLYELGLEPAVEWLAEHYRQRTGIEVRITSDEGRSRLSEEVNIVLFKDTRELLINVAKHARAKKVSVDWKHDKDALVLTVADDGVGFDVYSPRARLATEGGFGLFAVRERLNLLGADFDIQSSDTGTRVTISAPVYSG